MSTKSVLISLIMLLIKNISCQFIGNVGSALLTNPATSVPVSLANAATIPASLLANTATASAPISLANSAITASVPLNTGSFKNALQTGTPSSVVASAVTGGLASGLLANSAVASGGLSVGAPKSVAAAPVSVSSGNFPSGRLANSAALTSGGLSSAKPSVLTVTSTSPIYPTGIFVNADSIYLEGPMTVSGKLPYLGTIAFDGSLASSGQGVATCGCGNGNIGISNEVLGGAVSGGLSF